MADYVILELFLFEIPQSSRFILKQQWRPSIEKENLLNI